MAEIISLCGGNPRYTALVWHVLFFICEMTASPLAGVGSCSAPWFHLGPSSLEKLKGSFVTKCSWNCEFYLLIQKRQQLPTHVYSGVKKINTCIVFCFVLCYIYGTASIWALLIQYFRSEDADVQPGYPSLLKWGTIAWFSRIHSFCHKIMFGCY